MKYFIGILLLLVSVGSHADIISEKMLNGVWRDKNIPSAYAFKFNNNNDFVFTHKNNKKWVDTKGAWEVGSWMITFKDKTKKKCNLSIYAGGNECCLSAKFIAKNLILTSVTDDTGHPADMCSNKVLIKSK